MTTTGKVPNPKAWRNDVMTYLSGCGKKRFVRADVRCGENKRRDCDSGEATQNSHKRLLDVLGPRKHSHKPIVLRTR